LNERSIPYDHQHHHHNPHPTSSTTSSTTTTKVFECGENWINEALYNNKKNNKKKKERHDNNNVNNNTVDDTTDDAATVVDDDHDDVVEYDYYGSIVPSMINFWLACEADVFVGVAKSSWSTDVWTTRYYMGKGHTNYQYIHLLDDDDDDSGGDNADDSNRRQHRGIIPVPNGGLPPSHKSC
jgi:hypothetical protein